MFVTCLDPLRHTEWTSETRTQPSRIAVVGRLKRIEQRMLLLLLCCGKTGGTIYTCTCCSRACNVPDWERPCGRKASGSCVVSERASERARQREHEWIEWKFENTAAVVRCVWSATSERSISRMEIRVWRRITYHCLDVEISHICYIYRYTKTLFSLIQWMLRELASVTQFHSFSIRYSIGAFHKRCILSVIHTECIYNKDVVELITHLFFVPRIYEYFWKTCNKFFQLQNQW